MTTSPTVADTTPIAESDEVFQLAAELFRVMSAPMRLRIISSLCNGEKNVGELLRDIPTTQPNMSQHLHTLYRAGVLDRRRDGVQIYYRIVITKDRKSTRLNSSHSDRSRMPSSA